MHGVWRLLRYDEIAFDVVRFLCEGPEIAVLEGPPGVGKSWLAQGIGGLWKSAGGEAVSARGDIASTDIPLFPFGYAMSGIARGWGSVGTALGGVVKAGEILLGTGGIVTATIQSINKLRAGRRTERTLFLGEAEQGILHDLERSARDGPLLLIADNFHWWDRKSIGFLRGLRDPRLVSAFPFLTGIRVLAVQTIEPYQSVVHPDVHDAFTQSSDAGRFQMDRIPRQGFENLLAALGAGGRPDSKVADAVYSLSGGHLALARRCAIRIKRGEAEAFLSADDADDFLRKLLSDRLYALGEPGRKAVELLSVAAVLGLTFRRDQLECASEVQELEASSLLRYCRDEDVLELEDGVGSFVHDLYRQYFLTAGSRRRVDIHERLGPCLRILGPSDYVRRSLNALDAERPREAGALGVQAIVKEQREGRVWQDLPARVLEAVNAAGLHSAAASLLSALRHAQRYEYRACLRALVDLPRPLPESLTAESDYLRARCLMSTRSDDDRAEGVAILEKWTGYEAEEPELGIRLLQLLLHGQTLEVDKTEARRLERHIQRFLIKRMDFDPAAEDALASMDRSAGGLYQPDVSLEKTKGAVAHYGPRDEQVVLRQPVEYYRCLVNFGANLIATAQYEEACKVYADVDRLIDMYEADVFPRLDLPSINRVLAEFRAGLVDVDEAIARQEFITSELSVEGDPFYSRSALGVYAALADDLDYAVSIFDQLHGELTARRNPEASTAYLVQSNRCVVGFLAGAVKNAQAEWENLSSLVTRIPYVIRPLLIRRHQLLAEVIDGGRPMSPATFDRCLLSRRPPEFGPLWDNIGRGFRLPEVEFWL